MSDVISKEELALHLIKDSIWSTASVRDQPSVSIIRWRVLQTDVGSRHLVGFNSEAVEGRVSTAIVEFDAGNRTVTTASGRLYRLVGPAAYDSDGDWVWGLWSRRNNVGATEDVSSFYERELGAL